MMMRSRLTLKLLVMIPCLLYGSFWMTICWRNRKGRRKLNLVKWRFLMSQEGFSHSSMQPCKGNDPGDEEVDIVGGNGAPISSFPPVEIEKDPAHRNSKCSSSSSSSSESGSSSSDSDSGTSSESESNDAKVTASFGEGKENVGTGANSDQKRNDIGDSEIGNGFHENFDLGCRDLRCNSAVIIVVSY
ncbi:transcription factor GTE10-like [Prunus persica]|uniref:transcription factor GTE10-like n=1 Tax=Prunus persica TaxID=3760 RepID=UPI0009AB22FF|nr:transcription factor GTE10-like [Prunus persica]